MQQVISMVELSAVSALLHNESKHLSGADVLLFVDNSAAISAFVKGGSSTSRPQPTGLMA